MDELIPKETPEIPATLEFNKCTKTNIEKIAGLVVSQVEQGNAYAEEEYVKAKSVKDVAEKIMEGLKPSVISHMSNKKTEYKGVTLQLRAGRVEYDFSDNPKWVALNEELESVKEKMKKLEDLMKKAMDFAGVCDEFGEVIPPAQIAKAAADSIVVTIPNK